ncbi:DUF2575 domain-containing protein [Citrobacter portucalensis]|uniref:DUF2575 domain-containing protein n=1 Tax=Citrobacter portucalensis TaxID=1639133 RepID=UPI00254E1DE8|nr:DUF2575 domain-containing protein [Citrobacter portucalensis]WOR29378.1 DUF2575 domain-containing protein [Citrobacter portucalensis]
MRSDGARFYQLACCEYSFSTRKIALACPWRSAICFITMKTILFLFRRNNRRLTLTAVQGILSRFSLF